MIEVFAGRLGGGKSYHAVKRICDHLAGGHYVYTNIELKVPEIKEWVADRHGVEIEDDQITYLTGEQIGEFHKSTPVGTPDSSVLIVVDEAHIWLNARDWGKASRDLMNYLTQSRKVYNDIIFISQNEMNVDKQIARLIQFVYRFRDLRKFKILGIGKWPLSQFLVSQFDYDGRTLLERRYEWIDKSIFKLYNTNALLSPIQRSGKISQRKILKKKKKSMFKLLIPLAILGLIFASYKGWKILHPPKPSSKAVTNGVGKVDATQPQTKKKIFDLYIEKYRGSIGEELLMTDMDHYETGKMCNLGLVEQISDRIARIRGQHGELIYVRATEHWSEGRQTNVTPQKISATQQSQLQIAPAIQAQTSSASKTPLGDRESARITQALAEPLKN